MDQNGAAEPRQGDPIIDTTVAHQGRIYDFLAGDMRYKDNLSTDRGELLWVCVQRPRARFLLEDRLRAWVHARRAARARPPA